MALDGTYEISIKTPNGDQNGKLVFETDGGALTGTSEAVGSVSPLQDGKADGDSFEFKTEANTPMGMLEITMKGKVDGDALTGEAITPFGPAPLSGNRIG
jgi:hypothetical protein